MVIFILTIYSSCDFFKKDNQIDHIFLITIDTLRSDHLSCYGYPRETTPFIDSLAAKGILFENAISQSATTCPSISSIMTGLYPFQHKVIANGYVLDNSYTTLAEILREKGVRTIAFTSTDSHFLSSNINQGFEFYEEPLDTEKTYGCEYRQARLTIDNVILWLYNFNPEDRLFLWIHLFDPHTPYYPPDRYYRILDKETDRDKFIDFLKKSHINLKIFENSTNKLYEYITSYDAEIRYADEELNRFHRFVENRGLNKNSIWIITSDHGECLGQHSWLKHGKLLYKEAINVPLIFYLPEFNEQQVIKDVVENFNIFPTVLEAFNVDINNQKNLNTLSLWTKLQNPKRELQKKIAFCERRYYEDVNETSKDVPFWEVFYEKGEKYSIQNKNFKYIFKTEGIDEFYDLENDLYELFNLIESDKFSLEKKELRNELFEILKEKEKYKDTSPRIADRKVINKLKSLGYVR